MVSVMRIFLRLSLIHIYRENSIMKPVDMSESMQERIKGMVGIRNCTQELINLQLEEYPDTVIKEKQKELNTCLLYTSRCV